MDSTFENISVLLIEDNKGDARLIEEMLKHAINHSFEFNHSDTLSGGIEHLGNHACDVVLLDLSLPDSHGMETYEKVHKHSPQIPIIMLTGLNDQSVALETVQKGAQDYLVKGEVDSYQLERAIRYAQERSAILTQLRESRQSLKDTKEQLESALNNINEDLETARKVQHAFLPNLDGNINSVEIAGYYSPSVMVGGDLYDVIKIDDDNLAFVILDVAGHGVASALISAMAKISFARNVDLMASPKDIFSKVNQELIDYFPNNIYFTSFLGILNIPNKTFVYSSAGHPASFLINATSHIVKPIQTKGAFIGLFPENRHDQASLRLGSGDKILMYTDGITECMNSETEMYGKDRLKSLLENCFDKSPQEIVDAIMKDQKEFAGDLAQQDDITLLVFRIP